MQGDKNLLFQILFYSYQVFYQNSETQGSHSNHHSIGSDGRGDQLNTMDMLTIGENQSL